MEFPAAGFSDGSVFGEGTPFWGWFVGKATATNSEKRNKKAHHRLYFRGSQLSKLTHLARPTRGFSGFSGDHLGDFRAIRLGLLFFSCFFFLYFFFLEARLATARHALQERAVGEGAPGLGAALGRAGTDLRDGASESAGSRGWRVFCGWGGKEGSAPQNIYIYIYIDIDYINVAFFWGGAPEERMVCWFP